MWVASVRACVRASEPGREREDEGRNERVGGWVVVAVVVVVLVVLVVVVVVVGMVVVVGSVSHIGRSTRGTCSPLP